MTGRGDRLVALLTIGMVAGLAAAMAIVSPARPVAQGGTETVYVHLPLILRQPTDTPTATATVHVSPTATSTATRPPAATATTAPGVCLCYADLYNCDDFATQSQAQACYDYCWSLGCGDVHHLDADHDGIVCEWLP